MFYRVEYKIDSKNHQDELSYNKCYVMLEAEQEDDLKKIIDKDINESLKTPSPIVDVDIFEISSEDYIKEERKHLEALILNQYIKTLDNSQNLSFTEYRSILESNETKAKAYHLYLNKLVASAFLEARVNLDDISASTYLSYKDRLASALNTDDYESVVKEILESN